MDLKKYLNLNKENESVGSLEVPTCLEMVSAQSGGRGRQGSLLPCGTIKYGVTWYCEVCVEHPLMQRNPRDWKTLTKEDYKVITGEPRKLPGMTTTPKRGKPKGKRNMTPLERRAVYAMVKEGKSIDEVASETGYHHSTIRRTYQILKEELNPEEVSIETKTAPQEVPYGNDGVDYAGFIEDCQYLAKYYTELAEMASKIEKIEKDRETAETYANKIRGEVNRIKNEFMSL